MSEIDVYGTKAVEYTYGNSLRRVLDYSNISKMPIFIDVVPVNKEDKISDLLNDTEIKSVLDSIRFTSTPEQYEM